jgi:hypothetical protein
MNKKHDSSWKNLEDYRKGQARLKNAVLQHPEENPSNSMYHYLKQNIKRDLWVSQNLKPKEK